MLAVTVIYAAAGIEATVALELPAPSTVADAVAASGLFARLQLDPTTIAFAIYGQRADPATPLRTGDRIELTRPLLIDAKAARRARAALARKR
jgi:putative ubiquitin-RnfH superfamily antitoxin RatB of RatAB toxin-antitoxin module